MTSPRLLDLYCGAGGAAMGYHRAGFKVTGVDIAHQPNYPFKFRQADVASLDPEWISQFDLIHASPPCQRYSNLAKRTGNGNEWPDLVEPTRQLLKLTGRTYVIENVVGAPLIDPITLCGAMFPTLRVYRHRLFESNQPLAQIPHLPHKQLCYTMDKRKPHYGRLDEMSAFVQVTGGGNSSKAAAADAMGIDWMGTKRELNEAIPPAFTEHIGLQLLDALEAVAA